MQSISRRTVVGLGAAALAAAGLGAVSFLSAAIPASAQTTTTTTSTSTSATTSAHHGRRDPGFGRGFLGGDLSAVASALKLATAQLQQQLRAGKSIAQIAQAQNVPLTTVEAAIVAATKSRLDQAVAAGRITGAQETQQLNTLQSRLSQIVNATPGSSPRGGARPARSHPLRRTGTRS